MEANALSLGLLIVIGSCGIAVSLVSLIALHFLSTPVHPVRDAICDHASYRFGFLFRLQCAASGISGICLFTILVGLGYAAPTYGIVVHLGIIALGCFTLARLAIIFFPSDVEPPRTARGTVHMVLDVLLFIGISYASGFLNYCLIRTRVFGTSPWAYMGVMLWASAALTELCAALTIITVSYPKARKFMGLNERILYLGILLWFGAAFVPMLKLI